MPATVQDPAASIQRADEEYRKAAPSKDLLGLRDAAEKAWLAVVQATDEYLARKYHKVIEPGPDASAERVLILTTRGHYDIVQQYRNLRDGLHSTCFYGGACSASVQSVDMIYAAQYVSRMASRP